MGGAKIGLATFLLVNHQMGMGRHNFSSGFHFSLGLVPVEPRDLLEASRSKLHLKDAQLALRAY